MPCELRYYGHGRHLASDAAAAYVTGTTFVVDGGVTPRAGSP